jgi:hypothetical protein
MLQSHPFCACSFSLARTEYWEQLPQRLTNTIESGLTAYRQTFIALEGTVLPMLQEFAEAATDEVSSSAALNLVGMLKRRAEIHAFTTAELQVLQRIFENSSASDLVIEVSPDSIKVMTENEFSGDPASIAQEFAEDGVVIGS